MRPWLKKHVLIVALASLALASLLVTAFINSEPAPPPIVPKSVSATDVLSMCPPGHRVEFKYGSTSLYVDLQWVSWITTGSLVYEKFGGVCPDVPVEGVYLYFGGARSAGIKREFVERGLPEWLQISAHLTIPDPARIPSVPETRITLSNGGSIEDVTSAGSREPEWSTARRFRLQHAAGTDDAAPSPFMMGCGGNRDAPGHVGCTTLYSYNSDFRVTYRFSIWPNGKAYGLRDRVMIDVSVPQDLLAFDANVRAFVAELMRKP